MIINIIEDRGIKYRTIVLLFLRYQQLNNTELISLSVATIDCNYTNTLNHITCVPLQ